MLLAIGFCGFIYQVLPSLTPLVVAYRLTISQMLFTMGLQIETAGRGTMAVYVQVRSVLCAQYRIPQ